MTSTTYQPETGRRFHISTYGCQMNLADSSTIAQSLLTRGYVRAEREEDADIIILNTCSVREKAEDRIYGRLGEIYRFKKERPDLQVAVVGCMAQRLGDELIRQVPHVDFVLGTDRQFELPDVLEGREGTDRVMTAFGHEDMDAIEPIKETPFSGFVTIARGCNNYCTYCIVPFVRGKERSHSPDYIVAAVRDMVAEGVVEVNLLGQNVNSYHSGDTDFADLLLRVARETGIARIRYMTSHPKDCSKKLIHAMRDEPKILPHIHLPIQCGSDRVLRKMGRFYSVAHYLRVVDYIKEQLPNVALSTDIIVGFPTETEAEFEMTLDAVRRVRYDTAFMFRYSVRPGTLSAREFEDDIPEAEKIRRLTKLIQVQQQISYECNQAEIGRVHRCLVEGTSKRSQDIIRVRTETNKTVLIANGSPTIGTIVPVQVSSADAFTLHGELVV